MKKEGKSYLSLLVGIILIVTLFLAVIVYATTYDPAGPSICGAIISANSDLSSDFLVGSGNSCDSMFSAPPNNIDDGAIINTSGITLDCLGKQIEGDGVGSSIYGIKTIADNSVIANCNVWDFKYNINLSSNNVLVVNSITNKALLYPRNETWLGPNLNATLLNTTFTESKIQVSSGSNLFVQYYVIVNVTNSTGSPINGSNVSLFNLTQGLASNLTGVTNVSGMVRFNVTDRVIQNSGTTNFTYIVYANATGNSTSNNSFNPVISKNVQYVNLVVNEVFFTPDSTNPVVNLTGPANGTNVTNSTVFFSGSFSDDVQLANATLYLWNSTGFLVSTNTTNISGIANTTNLSFSILTKGIYYWNYQACDTSNNCVYNSTNYTLNVDFNPPTFTNILSNASIAIINQFINFTVTVTDDVLVSKAWFAHTFDLTDKEIVQGGSLGDTISFGGATQRGQTFSFTTGSWYLRQACFMIANQSTMAGMTGVNLQVFATAAGIPTGSALTTNATIPISSINGTLRMVCANFTQPAQLSSGVMYAVAISAPTASSQSTIQIGRNSTAAFYAGGTLLSNTVGAWGTAVSDTRFNFTGSNFDEKNESLLTVNAITKNINQTKKLLWAPTTPLTYRWCANDSSNNLNCSAYQNYNVLLAADTIFPNGSILSPTNATKVNGNVSIAASVTDNIGVTYTSFQYKNSSISYTNFSGCGAVTGTLPICIWNTSAASGFVNSSEGYDIQIIVVDTSGNKNSTNPIRHYYIDRLAPIEDSRQVVYPSGQSSIRNGQSLIFRANTTDGSGAGINITRVNLTDLNGTGFTNMVLQSGSQSSGSYSFWNISVTLAGATSGSKQIPYQINDSANPTQNLFSSSFTANIDANSPTWDSLSRTPADPIYNNTQVTFQVHAIDNLNLSRYIFSSNFTGSFVNVTTNFTGLDKTSDTAVNISNLTTGNYSWYFVIFDDAGNSNQTTLQNISVIGNVPGPVTINLISPANNANISTASTTFQYNYTGSTASSCSLLIDDVLSNTTSSPSIDTTLSLIHTVADGFSHSWYLSCNNTDNQLYDSEVRQFNVDTGNPNATLLAPLNNTFINITANNFTANLTDNLSGLKNATLNIYNSSGLVNQTTITSITGQLQTVVGVVVTLVQGVYNWFYSVFDQFGNSFTTSNRTLTIDTTKSLVQFVSPTDTNATTFYGRNYTIINVTSTDTNLANITIRLYNSSKSLLQTNTTASSPNYINYSGLTGGIYYFNATSIDLAGNSNNTETRQITIDTSGDCGTTPFEGCTINTTRTITSNTYNIPGSINGGIRATASNIVIDCNGATFIGNYTLNVSDTNVRFTKVAGFNNVTWKNCNLQNYYTGIALISAETSGRLVNDTFTTMFQGIDVTSGDNIQVNDSTFSNMSQYGIYLEPNSNKWDNFTAYRNTFNMNIPKPIRADGHPVNKTVGLILSGNTVYNNSIYVSNSLSPIIQNNTVNSNLTSALLGSVGIQMQNLTSPTIFNNSVSGYDAGIAFLTDQRILNLSTSPANWTCGTLSTNVNLTANRLSMNDRGMKLRGLSGATIANNIFFNNTDGVDAYDVGLYLEECSSNIVVNNNNFSQTGSTGIFAEAQNGLIINNNTFDMVSQAQKQTIKVNDIFEYPAAIQISEMYKMFLQANRTNMPLNGENITFISSMRNNNVTISNNVFDADTQVYLMAQGVTNLTQDLSGYWYRKWSPFTYLADPMEYYIPNAQSRLYWTNSLGTLKDATNYSYGNTTSVYPRMQLNFTNSWEQWKNTNTTGNLTIARYNLTDSLLYYGNRTAICTNITTCDNNINVSLAPGINLTVLDNYNITEGVVRTYDAVWFYSSNNNSKHLASNLTNTIFSDIKFNVGNCTIRNIPYTSNGDSTINASFSCSNNVVTLTNMKINPSVNSNEINITYNVTDTEAPRIQFVSPTSANGSASSQNYTYINYTANDTNLGSSFIDFNHSMVGWFRLNNESGENSTRVKDSSSNSLNGTPINGASFTSLGHLGGAYTFDGVNDYINLSNSNLYSPNTTGKLTVSLWVNFATFNFTGLDTGYVNFLNKNQFGPTNTEWTFRVYNSSPIETERTCRMSFYIFNVTGGTGVGSYAQDNTTTTSCPLQNNTWINLVGVINGTHTQLYKNGVLRDTDLYAGTIFPQKGNATLKIGGDLQPGNSYLNGSVDDVIIFNRALSSDEILALYNSSITSHNYTLLSNGNYDVKAYSQDLLGNTNSTETRTITLDTTNPNGTLISPINNNLTSNLTNNFTVNATDSLSGLKNATLKVYNSTNGLVNSTTTALSGSLQTVIGTVVTLVDGVYKWFYSIFDLAGNSFATSNRTITLDTIGPTGSILNPPNNTKVNGNVILDGTAADANGVSYVYFQISNSTMAYTNITGCSTVTSPYDCIWDTSASAGFLNAGEGYNIKMIALDSLGNTNSSIPIKHYTIDRTIPIQDSRLLIYPGTQMSIREGQTFTFKVNVTDGSGAGIDMARNDLTSIDGSGLTDMTLESGSQSPGEYSYWTIDGTLSGSVTDEFAQIPYEINDSAFPDQNRFSNTFTLAIDNDAPTFDTISQDPINPVYNNVNTTFTVNAYDNLNLSYYIFSNNFTGNWENVTTYFTQPLSDIATNSTILSTGDYQYYWIFFDDAGNSNQTDLQDVSVIGNEPQTLVVSLISPDDFFTTDIYSNAIDYSYTNGTATFCNLFVNETLVDSVADPVADTPLEFIYDFDLGQNSWRIECNNTENTAFSSESRNIVIFDDTIPAGNLIDPIDNLLVNTTDNNFTVNATDDKSGLGSVVLNIYDSLSNLVNQTVVTLGGELQTTVGVVVTLTDGVYTWFYQLFDLSGNTVTTATNTLTIDSTPPNISIVYPVNGTNYNSVTSLNYTVNDGLALSECWYSLDEGVTNTSITCGDNVTGLTSNEGTNIWTIYANDSVGNTNSSSVTFFVDSINPLISFIDPTANNNSILSQNLINANVDITETNFVNLSYYLYNSSNVLIDFTDYDSISPNAWTGLSDGVYRYFARTYDILGNTNSTENRTITLDTINPLVQYVNPTENNNSLLTRNNIRVNVTSTDTNLANITIRLYNSIGTNVRTNTSLTSPFFINYTGLSDGVYYFNVTSIDLANNQNSTLTRNVSIDTGNPTAILITPANKTNSSTASNNFTVNLTDNIGLANTTFKIYNNTNSLVNQVTTIITGSVTTVVGTVVSVVDGIYHWFYQVFDLSGNSGISVNNTLTVDTTKPLIQYVNLTEVTGSALSRTNINVNVTASDSLTGIKNITIRLYNSVGALLQTNVSTISPNYVNYTNLIDGLYYFNATAYDYTNNTNSTLTRNVTIDTGSPVILILYPTSTNYLDDYNYSTQLNVSVVDSNPAARWYSLNNGITNTTFAGNTTVGGLVAGSNTITFYANDTSGNRVSTSVTFNLTFTPKISNIVISNSTISYNETSYTNGLVGWYKLDQNYTIQEDSSSYSDNGTVISNATFNSSGKVGGSYTFDGINSYVTIPSAPQYNFANSNQFTYLAWIYPKHSTYATLTTQAENTSSAGYNITRGAVTYRLANATTGVAEIVKTVFNNTDYGSRAFVMNGNVTNASSINYTLTDAVTGEILAFSTNVINTLGTNGQLVFKVFQTKGHNVNVSIMFTNVSGAEASVDLIQLTGGRDGIISKSASYRLIISDSSLRFQIRNSTGFDMSIGPQGILTRQWQMVVAVYNGTHMYTYVNGVKSVATAIPGGIQSNNNPITLGRDPDFGSFSWMDMDEVRIYNRSLNDSEIQQIYSLTNPTFPESSNTTINVTLKDEDTTSSNTYFSWFVDNILQPMSGLGQNIFNYLFVNRNTGVTLVANDTNNYTVTQNWNITLTIINPTISFIAPTPNNNINTSVTTLFINITGVEVNRDTVWVRFNNTNYTTSCSGSATYFCNLSIPGLVDGIYNYTAYINDTSGARNNTETRIIKIDLTPPTGSILNPPNNTKVNGNVILDGTAADTYGVAYVSFQIKNSTMSYTNLSGCSNVVSPYDCTWNTDLYDNNSEGYDIKIVPVDINGNVNSSTIAKHYIIDRLMPRQDSRQVVYPAGQSSIRNTQTLVFRVNVTDGSSGAGVNQSRINLTLLNGTGLTNMLLQSGSVATGQYSFWNISVVLSGTTTDEFAQIPYEVNDSAVPVQNRMVNTFTLNIDNNKPTFDGVSVDRVDPIYNNTNVTFSVTAYDNYLLSRYIFSNNFTGSWVNVTTNFTQPLSEAISNSTVLTVGNYSYYWIFFDDAGNSNQTSVQNINILGNEPEQLVVSLINPNDAYSTESSLNTFEYSYTNGTASACILYLNDIASDTTATPTSDTTLSFTTTLSLGTYNWRVDCNNSYGNIFSSETRVLTIDDITPPSIEFVSPTEDDNVIRDQSYIIVNVTADDLLLSSVSIDIYNSTGLVNSTSSATAPFYLNISGLADGVYTYNATAIDTSTNTNSTETRTITLDTTNPNAVLIDPVNTTNSSSSSNNFTANLTDNMGLANATLNIYNSTDLVNQTTFTFSGELQNIVGTVVNLIDGVYSWFYSVFDIAGHNFTTENNTITIDTNSGNLSYVNPTENNDTTKSQSFIQINATSTDTNLANITVEVYNLNYFLIRQDVFSSSPIDVTYPLLQDGIYYYNVTSYDFAGNRNDLATRTIILDTTPPILTIDSPQVLTYTSSAILVNLSVTDALSSIDTMWYNNGTSNITYSSPTVLSLANGAYSFVFYANDSVGNTMSSTVDFSVNVQQQGGGGGGGGGYINNTNVTTPLTNGTGIPIVPACIFCTDTIKKIWPANPNIAYLIFWILVILLVILILNKFDLDKTYLFLVGKKKRKYF